MAPAVAITEGFAGHRSTCRGHLVAEISDLRRFSSAPQFLAYLGFAASEFSSGVRRRCGGIERTGNGTVRRVLIESAWCHRFQARHIRHRQHKASEASQYAKDRARVAQKRLCTRYRRMVQSGKNVKVTVTAVARELAGFVWDIACHELNRLDADIA